MPLPPDLGLRHSMACAGFICKRRGVIGLGLGDVKLVAATGAWVGLEYLPVTLLLASCSGLAAALLRRYRSGTAKLGPQSAVPLGSFIAPATVMFWILLLPGR